MSEAVIEKATSRRRIGRSILALLAGFVVVVILSIGTDAGLHAMGIFPALGQPIADGRLLLLATAYRTLYGLLSSYVTARVAPYRPMLHAMVGGCVGLTLNVVGLVSTWNSGLGHHWYPITLTVLALPTAWAGGKLFEMQMHGQTVAQ